MGIHKQRPHKIDIVTIKLNKHDQLDMRNFAQVVLRHWSISVPSTSYILSSKPRCVCGPGSRVAGATDPFGMIPRSQVVPRPVWYGLCGKAHCRAKMYYFQNTGVTPGLSEAILPSVLQIWPGPGCEGASYPLLPRGERAHEWFENHIPPMLGQLASYTGSKLH